MSRQEDLLFCKIAISNRLISPEQAQKCLVVCNRREQESGRRPMVGAVITKYNLLRPQEVQRIYAAVNKRLGTTAGAVRPAPPAGRRGPRARGRTRGPAPPPPGGHPRRHAGTAFGRQNRQPLRRVDPNTLWMGIGFGVIFLGVVSVMLMLWLSGPDKSDNTDTSGRPDETAASSSGASSTGSGLTAVTAVAEKGPGEAAKVIETEEMEIGFRKELLQVLNDTRKMGYIEERPQEALDSLQTFLQANKAAIMSPEMKERVSDLIKDLKAQAAGQESSGSETQDSPADLGQGVR